MKTIEEICKKIKENIDILRGLEEDYSLINNFSHTSLNLTLANNLESILEWINEEEVI